MEYFDRISILAHATPQVEICGFVAFNKTTGKLEAVPCTNSAAKPSEDFRIEPGEMRKTQETHDIVACYHSHPENSDCKLSFSPRDKAVSEELAMPFYVYSVDEADMIAYLPKTWNPPLDGRRFVPLIWDCLTLAEDFYIHTLKIPIERTARTFRNFLDPRFIPAYIKANGFQPFDKPKPGDVIVMSPDHSGPPQHVGVLVEDGIFMHQKSNSRSEALPYGGLWERSTTYFLRHKSRI